MNTHRNTFVEKAARAALELAATMKWDDLTLAAIAKQAGLSLADFHGLADRNQLLQAVDHIFDAAMSAESPDADAGIRERLFDTIMMRFEAMEAVRDAALSYLYWRDRLPAGLSRRTRACMTSARWALACSDLDHNAGLRGVALVTGLAFTIARAENAWKQETDTGMNRTMAALDAALIRLEEQQGWLLRS